MRNYKVSIEGIAPLRMNRFTQEAKDTLQGGRKKKSKDDQIQEAYDRAYTDSDGKYIIPKKAIKACILNGAKKVPLGKGKAKTDMKAILYVMEDAIIPSKFKDIITEETVRIPPRTGAIAIKYFVTFPKWKIDFEVQIVDDRFPEPVVQEAIKEAGIYAGLLDGRPDFGRFIMTEFKKVVD